MSRTAVLRAPPSPSPTAASGAPRDQYRQAIATTLAGLTDLAAELTAAPHSDAALVALRHALRGVHAPAGAGGFPEASRLAAAFETRVARWICERSADGAERGAEVHAMVAELTGALAADPAPPAARGAYDGPCCHVVIVDGDAELAARLRAAARVRGLAAVVWAPADCTPEALTAAMPDVVIGAGDLPPDVALACAAATRPLLLAAHPPGGVVTRDATVLEIRDDVVPLLELAERLAARTGWRGATVMMVDDDADTLTIACDVLGARGLRVVPLSGADDLEARLEAERPALLLLDVRLGVHSEVDGIDIAARLRASRAFAGLPILMFSAAVDAETRAAAHAAGADEFIPKPMVPAALRARVERWLEQGRATALAAEAHPVTRIASWPRAWRELEQAVHPVHSGRPAAGALAVVRCAAWRATARAHGAWLRDAGRLAHALRAAGAVVGHHDEATLVIYAPLAAAAVARLLRREVREPGAWSAGVVDARAGAHDPARLLRMASALADGAQLTAPGAVRVHSARTATAQPQVMLVEHDPLLAASVESALRLAGVSFRTYAVGAEALAALEVRPAGGAPPLVLLDHELPGVDGHALYAWLCDNPDRARHVVCTSAMGHERDEVRALRAGALDYIRVPLAAAVLAARLPLWLRRASA